MKTALFLYNPQSGKGRIDRCVGEICTVFGAYGYEVRPQEVDFDTNPFDGNETIDLMVVAGGDGSVNFVLNAMKRKGLDIPIGVIPAGTANDFAGALGMSPEPLVAARQIASGVEQRVDCGRVNDLYFVNIFSFGIFTTTSQRTPDERKHRIGVTLRHRPDCDKLALFRAAVHARRVGAPGVGGRVQPCAVCCGAHLKMAVRVGRVGQRRIAGIAHNAQRVPAGHPLPGLDQQPCAVGKVEKIHRIRGLRAVKLHTEIPAPLPGPVLSVGHDARPRHPPGDPLSFITGHPHGRIVQPHQIQTAVPHTAAAPCKPKAGVGVGDPGAPCKDTALPHAVTPPCAVCR